MARVIREGNCALNWVSGSGVCSVGRRRTGINLSGSSRHDWLSGGTGSGQGPERTKWEWCKIVVVFVINNRFTCLLWMVIAFAEFFLLVKP